MAATDEDPAIVRRVEGEVARVLARRGRVLLAVSGGRDSMAMLEAASRVAPERIAVATFDHGTGAAATAACELAAARARALGLAVERGRAEGALRGEAAWREARWRFLRAAATRIGAAVATAHTEDDQLETVLMRAMRGAGARGLAGLYAGGPVLRPLLALRRDEIAAYVAARGVSWVEDPSNASRAYLRNRVRLDLLPALERARPGLRSELLELARRAAAWRAEVEERVAQAVPARVARGALAVARADLRRYDAQGLMVVWPALAARAGVMLDRRGTHRLSEFTIRGAAGARMQLAGGLEVVLHRGHLLLRHALRPWDGAGEGEQPLGEGIVFGGWRFRRTDGAADGPWSAVLPADAPLVVRAWRPGDRMLPLGSAAPRRAKGLFRDAGIDAGRRRGWPVVLAGGEIVWIPGVRRSGAAAARSGRPTETWICERINERDDG